MFSSSLILVFKIIALTYYFGSTLSNKEKKWANFSEADLQPASEYSGVFISKIWIIFLAVILDHNRKWVMRSVSGGRKFPLSANIAQWLNV